MVTGHLRQEEKEGWACRWEGWHNLSICLASWELTASPVAMVTHSKLPSEDGSVISNESERMNSGMGLTMLKVTAQQKLKKEETNKRDGESFVDANTNDLLCCSTADKVRCFNWQKCFRCLCENSSQVSFSQACRYLQTNAWHCSFFIGRKVTTQQ